MLRDFPSVAERLHLKTTSLSFCSYSPYSAHGWKQFSCNLTSRHRLGFQCSTWLWLWRVSLHLRRELSYCHTSQKWFSLSWRSNSASFWQVVVLFLNLWIVLFFKGCTLAPCMNFLAQSTMLLISLYHAKV